VEASICRWAPLSPFVIQADYYLTNFANGVNDHQNNLLLGAGVVFHWSTQK
jgi:hypothetical protein